MPDSSLAQPYPWQEPQWRDMGNLIAAGRLPHALLFQGPESIGKLRFAQAFAERLLCERPVESGACGECESCVFLKAGSHPDCRRLQPAEGKRQIQVDQVRDLIEFCAQTAYRQGGRKLAIVAPAEAMNRHTANALLKTLEEPAGNTVLILVSHAPSVLLPTVRSRCLPVSFPLPERERAAAWLAPLVGGVDAGELLDEAGGRPLAALGLFESDGLAARQACDEVLADMHGGRVTPVEAAESLLQNDAEFVVEWLILRLNALGKRLVADSQVALPSPWTAWRSSQPRTVYTLLQEVLELRRRLQQGVAVNKRLAVESLLLQYEEAWL